MAWFRFTVIIFLLIETTACQDELRDRYNNPNNNAPTIGNFFTALLDNERVRPSYWEISTFVNWHIGTYGQSVGYLNSQSMYQQNDSYIQNRWDDYYRPSSTGAGTMALFREIEKAHNKLSSTQKKEVEVFVQASRVILYDQTSQMVDLWGDIPFSEAGSLNGSGSLIYPKFDTAEEVYNEILEGLNEVTLYFSDPHISQASLTQFAKQDILLAGDVTKWLRYANSLRLRLLMRLSFVQEEQSKAEVLNILNNETQFPLLNTDSYTPGKDDILLQPISTYAADLHDAFWDWTNYPAPYYALEEVLKPANDLRIPVLYDRYGKTTNNTFIQNTDYNALPLTLPATEQQENLEEYAVLDSATFLYNSKLPGVVFTATEVNFLRAEAYERWGGGDANQEYALGIKNSIKFYYYLNGLNTIKNPLEVPSDLEIDNFIATNATLQYPSNPEDRLAIIWTQKWVHYGFLQSIQSWSELRRTGYPKLIFNPSPLMGYELPPGRLTYPDNEKKYNKNYATVADKDLRSIKIFWDVN